MPMPSNAVLNRASPLGSGTAERIAIPCGLFNPVISAAFIGAPVMASYSPIVFPVLFATNRWEPDSAIPTGQLNPETSAALIGTPVVASYSPIVPIPHVGPGIPEQAFATNRFEPDCAMPSGKSNPERSEEHT